MVCFNMHICWICLSSMFAFFGLFYYVIFSCSYLSSIWFQKFFNAHFYVDLLFINLRRFSSDSFFTYEILFTLFSHISKTTMACWGQILAASFSLLSGSSFSFISVVPNLNNCFILAVSLVWSLVLGGSPSGSVTKTYGTSQFTVYWNMLNLFQFYVLFSSWIAMISSE